MIKVGKLLTWTGMSTSIYAILTLQYISDSLSYDYSVCYAPGKYHPEHRK